MKCQFCGKERKKVKTGFPKGKPQYRYVCTCKKFKQIKNLGKAMSSILSK